MDEERIKHAVLAAIERTAVSRAIADAVAQVVASSQSASLIPPPLPSEIPAAPPVATAATKGTQKLLTRIVLGDLLDESILGARPSDRAFPLRLFFGDLGTMLAEESDDGPKAQVADQAFTLASGLNFFLRASMDPEAKTRVGLEVSRQFYELAHAAKMDAEMVSKAAPLLATIMNNELERVKLEAIDHAKVFDSSVHERTAHSDAASSRILRPASFLARVTANNAVKAKAQVVT
ncbi:MAG: hypothetical protein JST00_11515 [Deltaproteobacteria bacterium]|nr:hypothetical protein [Deltaproteobacteria bacterium]